MALRHRRLAETIEALRLDLATVAGRMPGLEEIQQQMADVGLSRVQFTFLAASRCEFGDGGGGEAVNLAGAKAFADLRS